MSGYAQRSEIEDFTQVERQFQRVDVTLYGRFMNQNKQEYPCEITKVSPGSAELLSSEHITVGEKIIAYVDHLGRLEGEVLRKTTSGFAISINATTHKRDKLAAKITWVANRHELNLPEDRRHERMTPNKRPKEIKLEDGRTYSARILDLSLSGAAIEMDVRPAMGTLVMIGNMRGRVIRHFDDGVAIEFAMLQSEETLKDFIN